MTAVAAARAGIVAGGVLVGLLSASRAYDADQPWLRASDLAVTVAFAAVAATEISRSWRVAVLAGGVCATWALAAWWPFAVYWHRGILIALLVLLIAGTESLWPRRGLARVIIVVSCAVSFTPFVWQSDAAGCVLGIGLVAAAVALRPRREGRAAMLSACALIVLGVVFAAAALPIAAVSPLAFEVRAVGYASGLVAVAALAARAGRPQSVARATDAVLELGAKPDDAVRDRVAAALQDRSLEIGWWSAGEGRFLTGEGAEVVPPPAGGSRRELIVDADGKRLAIVIGDARRIHDRGVREAILRATALVAEHAKLTARIREATREVEDSRRRIIESAAVERLALAAELEMEVGQPLRALRAELALVGSGHRLGPATDLVERTLAELAAIATGLHPAALERGLAGALAELAGRAPVPVDLRIDAEPDDEVVAQAAYYVCAEALANAVRHADCTRVTVRVAETAGRLDVSIIDDGRGGAVARPGSGLAGLRDRVAGIGGTLELSSIGGGGTAVSARLPRAIGPALVEGSR